MKRISHITDITAIKNADLPILSITPITNHHQIPPTLLNKKRTEKHTTKKPKTILKTAQTKRNSTQKKEVLQKLKEKTSLIL